LSEGGFVEGKNVAIEQRWASGQYDRLPALAADLVQRQVAAIVASGGSVPTRAAQAATSTIPIVFTYGGDPVAAGLVASLNRPGGNTTGVDFFGIESGSKLLGLLHMLVPAATRIAALINPSTSYLGFLRDIEMGARLYALELRVLNASSERQIEEGFASFADRRPDGLIVQLEPFFVGQFPKILSLAMQNGIPTISANRPFAEAGGLMGYGANVPEAYQQAGRYVARILKGDRPADLPVVQSTRFELVINANTAKALGLTIPSELRAIADEVIE
jgi:putative ABC transport system substrate-binding protein